MAWMKRTQGFRRYLMGMVLLAGLTAGCRAAEPDPNLTTVRVDTTRAIATVPDGLYAAGYDGWGDLVDASAVGFLNEVGIRYLRLPVPLEQICSEQPGGPLDLDCTEPRDMGLGFADRIRTARANGWTPLLVITIHGTVPQWLPKWVKGESNDSGGEAWTHYNVDGTRAADGLGDQLEAVAAEVGRIAGGLADQGLDGMLWETMYEMGSPMPMVEIHHAVAAQIRQADASAKLMGPASWADGDALNNFLRPYLTKYGADLLDYVSVHWYASCDRHVLGLPTVDTENPESTVITMADREPLTYIMEQAPRYGDWGRQLRGALDDPALNPGGKRIGVVFSEFDADAYSPYLINPINEDWPEYRRDTDCYLNLNYFGGTWYAATLGAMAASGVVDIAFKYNTRQYFGILNNAVSSGEYYRPPLWFAMRLLQGPGGLTPGAVLRATEVSGPTDQAVAHLETEANAPWVSAFALGGGEDLRVILVNRSFETRPVALRIEGLKAGNGAGVESWVAGRYVFSEDRVARFIGRQPGTNGEGDFEAAPDDSANFKSLERVDRLPLALGEAGASLALECPAISITVLKIQPGVKSASVICPLWLDKESGESLG